MTVPHLIQLMRVMNIDEYEVVAEPPKHRESKPSNDGRKNIGNPADEVPIPQDMAAIVAKVIS